MSSTFLTQQDIFIFPLSSAQWRLWFLDQLSPGNTAYNITSALHLQGQLDGDILAQAIQQTVERHEILRTLFVAVDGEPRQMVMPKMDISLNSVDISDRQAEAEQCILEYVEQEASRPFDLARGPLLRFTLLNVSAQEHILITSVHHIIFDGWSSDVLTRELITLYQAQLEGMAEPLEDLPIQYADYATWQNEWLQEPEAAQQLAYWREKLMGIPDVVALPLDHQRPAAQTFRGDRIPVTLEAPLVKRLQQFAQQENATLFMVLLAALQLLLYRYSGQEDIVIGTPIAGRNQIEIEQLIGCFVNNLVLRIEFHGNPTIRELLGRVRRTALDAYRHQDIPFEQLVETLQPARDPAYSPLFQVMFIFHNTPAKAMALPTLSVRSLKADNKTSKYDLTLDIAEQDGRIEGVFEFNTDLFEHETIRRLSRHFLRLLASIVSDPQQQVASIPLMEPEEYTRLLILAGSVTHEGHSYPAVTALHQLFEAHARETPQALALIQDAHTLTYEQLNQRSNQLAHFLCAQGLKPDQLVGLYLERSVDLIVSLLAILKAGGAYLPLDPAYPVERLNYMLEESQARFLITESALSGQLSHPSETVFTIDTEREHLATYANGNPALPVHSEQSAYTIYTSGSTGKPKGIMIRHAAILNFLSAMSRKLAMTEKDALLAITSLSFDISVLEIFLPLINGARLVLASREESVSGHCLQQLIEQEQITIMQATPASWRMLLLVGWPGHAGLRMLCGGEALTADLAAALLTKGAVLWNMYGPTETTIWSAMGKVEPGMTPPLGLPIDRTSLYVLSSDLELVPFGVPGELWIGGAGMARGYLQQPALTAERFLPDPFSSIPDQRMYRTGDLVRRLCNGDLQYLGRTDFQVKVRGFRIELSEIERVLAASPYVQEAVVTVQETAEAGKTLVGYIVKAPGSASADERALTPLLQEHLRQSLPEYMVPHLFMVLPAFPLTANRKVNRQALPAVEHTQHELTMPESPLEEQLVTLWQEILKQEKIGVEDNFFALGGHSILAVQMADRLKQLLGVEVALRVLFERTTIRTLAQWVEAELAQRGQDMPDASPATQLQPQDQLPMTAAQQRLWFLEHLQPVGSAHTLLFCLPIPGPVQAAMLEASLNELVRRHEILHTTFALHENEPVQLIMPQLSPPLPIHDLTALSDEQKPGFVQAQIQQELQDALVLRQGPLLRTTLLLDQQQGLLLMSIHRSISDRYACALLRQELLSLYTSANDASAADTEQPVVQYRDYTHWEHSWVQGEEYQAQLAYWKQQLAGELPVLELPVDRSRPAVQSFHGATSMLMLPRELRTSVEQLSRTLNTTPFHILLAAFHILLYRYSAQKTILTGVPVDNRAAIGFRGMQGQCENTLVVRSELDDSLSFATVVEQINALMQQAAEHQKIPFEKLVTELQLERSLSYTPVFQSTFEWQRSSDADTLLASDSSRFDLSMSIIESDHELHTLVQYNTDIFEPATVERILSHWQTLLTGLVEHPEQALSTIALLNAREREQVLSLWNMPVEDVVQKQGLTQRIEEQAARHPQVPAVIYNDQSLTYEQLNVQANRLAHELIRRGIGPDMPVGLCLQRSPAVLVALLAILKAGGAYLPLDPAYPVERIAFMLADSNASILLTQSQLQEQFSSYAGQVLCLDILELADTPETARNPVNASIAANLAYVIYTSGSTGQPKGVCCTQAGVLNLHADFQRRRSSRPATRYSLWTTLNFDVSVFEVFTALLSGGTLYYADELLRTDGPSFIRWLAEQQIQHAYVPPFMVPELAAYVRQPAVPLALERLLVGVEPLQETMLGEIVSALPGLLISNGYGPTEATVYASVYDVPAGGWLEKRAPIGRAIHDTRIYLLDEQLQPVPIGLAGEIYIGGAGLARGYLNSPDATAEKFLPNPFGARAGARLYRTGDLARWRADGQIEFIGRADQQVKLRGFRIELGEIEHALLGYPGVKEACVLVREESATSRQLVAYITTEHSAGSKSELRTYLKDRLPAYMLPASFIHLEQLPLLPNGKVDRRALPAPTTFKADTYEAPRNDLEMILATIWSQLLQVERVGIHDDFFALGGHSLLITQFASRIRQVFECELPLRDFFNLTTIAELAHAIEAAMQREQGMLAPAIVATELQDELTLSYAQQRLWFIDQLDTRSSAYNLPGALRLQGALNLVAMERSIEEVIRRHESLRTSFRSRSGRPYQVIMPPQRLSIPVTDLHLRLPQLSLAEREDEARSLLLREADRPFDLTQDALFRYQLIKLADDDHVLFMNVHHIVFDGWSLGVLIREITVLYNAYSSGLPSPLAEPVMQYRDFALWQRQWLSGEVLQAQVDYWKEALAGAPTTLDLPFDFPRPPVQTHVGQNLPMFFERDFSSQLKQFSQSQNATLFMVLLAAFDVLLYRYSGQDDLLVGSPIANRNRAELEAMIGFFVNTLVLRARLSGNPSFEELLKQVRETALGAYTYQEPPFEYLVEMLQPDRDTSHSALFQVMFILQNAPEGELAFNHLASQSFAIEATSAKFDLTVWAMEVEEGLALTWNYNTDLFEEQSIKQMMQHYQAILRQIIKHPRQGIDEISLLGAVERQQIVDQWNATRNAAVARPLSLPERLAAHDPAALAVVDGTEQLSYGHLYARSNQLAQYLRAQGVGPDVLVGLCMERSVEMIIALIAIHKAGGAYVPLDPNYPVERIQHMIADSQMPLVITQQRLQDVLSAAVTPAVQLVYLDAIQGELAHYSNELPPAAIRPENVAYVIYTSGSTGQPKGVLLLHSGLLNHTLAAVQEYKLSARDRVLQFSSLSFDIAIEEIFPILSCGGTLVLRNDEMLGSAAGFLRAIDELQITVLDLPTAYWHTLVASLKPEATLPERLRLVIVGGEKASPELYQRWQECSKDVRWLNTYGPTEATVIATVYDPRKDMVSRHTLPIGRPIANVRTYIVDPLLQPVPPGVKGELLIGGAGVARGYLGDPVRTAERFIPDPFSAEPGSRLYRTGDLARYLKNGDIEFAGRIDHQMKIRGYRIEPGEIEAVLQQHPAIRECIIQVQESAVSHSLVAYVVVKSDMVTSENVVSALRTYLRDRIPEYMIPATFVLLEQMPLTSNGKIDLRALSASQYNAIRSQPTHQESQAPRTITEEIVSGIWSDLLHRQQIGMHDNFFELGGHSLLATQVISRLSQAFDVDLPLRVLFMSPTVAELASEVDKALQTADGTEHRPALVPMARQEGEELPTSFAQARLWFIDQFEPNSASYTIPLAVRLYGPLDMAALRQSLREVVARHETLRTTFQVRDGEPVQRIASSAEFALSVLDLSTSAPQERAEQIRAQLLAESLRPFDLRQGPLLRVQLLRESEQVHLLQLTMHHIISDGWSVEVLLGEVARLYNAFRRQEPSPLPALPVQYADYASWQRGWLQGALLERQVSYWQQKLAGAPPLLELPLDHPRPAIQTYNGAVQTMALEQELSQALQRFSQQEGVTLFMTLLAAFQVLLARMSRQEDILVGTPIAGRTHQEIEGLIGFFVNTLVLRSQVSGEQSFRQLLALVRTSALEAYAHQDLPFEKLVEVLQPQRTLSFTPLFQVMFTLQNASQQELELDGLRVEPVEADGQIAKFDLTLQMRESEQGLQASLEYNTDLFEASSITRMLGSWRTLLQAICTQGDAPIQRLPLLTAQEQRQTLEQFNQNEAAYPLDWTIPQALEPQQERTPMATALISRQERFSYAQVHQRANQLARYLQAQGVGPEVRVAVCLERTPLLVITLLAILKAGGVYVPLDPAYPRERLAFMLEDVQAHLTLSSTSLQGLLSEHITSDEIIYLDRIEQELARWPQTPPPLRALPLNLAYLIYTSGSTGRPKAIAITHRNAVAFLYWAWAHYQPEQRAVVMAATSICFDLTLFELFATLGGGGTILLATNALELAELPAKEEITLLNMVPSAVAELLNYTTLPRSVRVVNLAGEHPARSLVQKLYALGHIEAVYNLYGPSEDTTYTTCSLLLPDDEIHLGGGISNTRIYVLDSQLQPVAQGISGEIYISSAGLSRGYLGRPELTAERYLPDPFSHEPGARMYRTGDLGRYRSDGMLVYQGRLDFQVKLRGFRIELGEIETVLQAHPQIEQAAVLVREDRPGDKRLVAYVVGSQLQSSELRSYMQRSLPEYMVPGLFVQLDELPQTPNGKLDRRALPAPADAEQEDTAYIAPRNELEATLASIWEELLTLTRVSVTDNFFQLGGHSLLVLRLLTMIEQRLGQKISLIDLFQHASISELATLLKEQGKKSHSSLVPLQPQGHKRPFFCVHPVGGSIFSYLDLVQQLGEQQPFYGLQSAGLDHEQRMRFTIEEMAAGYIEEIRSIQPEGPYSLGGWSMGGVIAYEMAYQLQASGQQVDSLVMFDSIPQQPESEANRQQNQHSWMLHFLADLNKRTDVSLADIKLQSKGKEEEALQETFERARQSGLLPSDLSNERLQIMFNVYQVNAIALGNYRAPAFAQQVTLFRALGSQIDPGDPTMGWSAYALARVHVIDLSGDHYTIFEQANIAELAHKLQPLLDALK